MANQTPYPSIAQPPFGDNTIRPHVLFQPGRTPPQNHCLECLPIVTQADQRYPFVNILDPHTVLVYVAGSHVYNGFGGIRAACSYIDGIDLRTRSYSGEAFCLGAAGLMDRDFEHAGLRTKLCAVNVALNAHYRMRRNVRRLVVATDSADVADYCTS